MAFKRCSQPGTRKLAIHSPPLRESARKYLQLIKAETRLWTESAQQADAAGAEFNPAREFVQDLEELGWTWERSLNNPSKSGLKPHLYKDGLGSLAIARLCRIAGIHKNDSGIANLQTLPINERIASMVPEIGERHPITDEPYDSRLHLATHSADTLLGEPFPDDNLEEVWYRHQGRLDPLYVRRVKPADPTAVHAELLMDYCAQVPYDDMQTLFPYLPNIESFR